MAKNIVVLMDGTWDSPTEETNGELSVTNVVKLKNRLLENAQQIIYYDDGVGADAIGFSKLIAGETGLGIRDKIIQGYQFIMKVYNSGDNIYLFGFSRGAYAIRYLADFISYMGLLKLRPNITESETAQQQFNRVNDYYNQYHKIRNNNINVNNINKNIAQPCNIKMIGVWDTVGALGIPLALLKKLNYRLYEFHDTILHANVLAAYQALAIDEARAEYQPCLWNAREGIEQVWFAGVHSDIGGGYLESNLSDITLQWMINKATQQGILLDQLKLKSKINKLTPNPCGMLHNSRAQFPYKMHPAQLRVIPNNALINNSVKTRIANKALNYNPLNMPKMFTWV